MFHQGKLRFNVKTAISSSKLRHTEAPVKISPAASKANRTYLKPNIFHFNTLPAPGQGGTAGQTLTNVLKTQL